MSKTTAALAALGVVAGLGVAALPLSSYAAPANVSRNVELSATVNETLAFTLKEGTGHKLGKDVSETDKAGVTVTPDSTTGDVTTLGNTKINFGVIVADSDPNTAVLDANIRTNNASGYSLSIKNAVEADGGKVNGADAALANTTNATAFISSGTPAKGVSAWGYKIGAATGAATTEGGDATAVVNSADGIMEDTYYAVTTGGQTIMKSNNPTSAGTSAELAGDTLPITFGVSVSTAQATGTYKGAVTLTASVNTGV